MTTRDLDTGELIQQDLDADFTLTMWNEEEDYPEPLIDEGTPVAGRHEFEWKGEHYTVTVEIKRTPAGEAP